MKTENDFNGALSKKIRALGSGTFSFKASDKMTVGVSDFLIWRGGMTLALESKFIASTPSLKAQLLQHPFSGAQLTFLESLALSGNKAFGLVGIEDKKMMYLIPWDQIPASGNWKTADFFSHYEGYTLKWLDVGKLLSLGMAHENRNKPAS